MIYRLHPLGLLGYPPSGDRIGECVSYSHTLDEVLSLFETLNTEWSRGVDILRKLEPVFNDGKAEEFAVTREQKSIKSLFNLPMLLVCPVFRDKL